MKKFFLVLILFFSFCKINAFAGATYLRALEVYAARHAAGITFNPDGSTMYIVSSRNSTHHTNTTDSVVEYSLSNSFSLLGMTSNDSHDDRMAARHKCGGNNTLLNPEDIHWNNDGTRLFIVEQTTGNSNKKICQINLTTPYLIDTSNIEDTGGGGKEDEASSVKITAGSTSEDGHNTDVDAGVSNYGKQINGIDFNGDGTKFFVTAETEEMVHSFILHTAWDLSSAEYTGNSFDYSSVITSGARAIRFSRDGRQMFLTDQTEDKIFQWSLSSAFDLTSTITLRGSYNARSDWQNISDSDNVTASTTGGLEGLEFNNDGSKFFITMSHRVSTNDYHYVLEYELDCPYGIVYCESPVSGSDKVIIGTIEAYTEMSKRVMNNNIKPVMHRLEWLRRHRKDNNLTNQNLKFNFSNEMLASLAKVIPVGNKESSTNKEQQGDWFFWSEGQISIGDIEATSRSSRKEIDTSGITVGADKKVSENKIYGYALQFGRDSADIGNSAALLDTDNYSLVFYGTLPHEDGRFLDAAVGISTLKTDHFRTKKMVDLTRNSNSNLIGKRDGKQIFGSIKLNKIYYKKNININPTAKFDFGFTELATFQESGDAHALIYDKHQIPKGLASLGMLVDNTKQFNNGNILKPMVRLEYTADFSPSTNTNVSYVSDPNTDHFIRIGNQSTHNYKAGLGFDLSTVTGWSIILNYEIDYANGSGHTDNLNFAAGWVPNRKTEYALILNGSDYIMASLNIIKNLEDMNIKFAYENDLFSTNNNQKANISLSKVF